jgi:hypothetical protein
VLKDEIEDDGGVKADLKLVVVAGMMMVFKLI